MKVSPEDLDFSLVQEPYKRIFLKGDEFRKIWFASDLAHLLRIMNAMAFDTEAELASAFDELLIFFALVQIMSAQGRVDPALVPFQPPPKLEKVWVAFCKDGPNLEKLLAETGLPEAFSHPGVYDEPRRIDRFKAQALKALAFEAGIPIDEPWWAF